MDPNTLVEDIVEALTFGPEHGGFEAGSDLGDEVENLLDWCDNGGFFPTHDDTFALFAALFWYYYDCHGGQHSREYSLACRVGQYYEPGASECGPEPDSMGGDLYRAMVSLGGYDEEE